MKIPEPVPADANLDIGQLYEMYLPFHPPGAVGTLARRCHTAEKRVRLLENAISDITERGTGVSVWELLEWAERHNVQHPRVPNEELAEAIAKG